VRTRLLAVLAILAGYGLLQSFLLPADGFFAGDCAAKYLQARAVLANGPLRPWIEGPAIDDETALQWREPVLLVRRGHLVSQFSWLMPLLGAPFLGLLGLRGLYVIPAVAIGVIFLATSSMGRTLGQPAGGAWSGWCAVLATPLLFYGAELWEHAPAVALTAVATALLVRDERLTPRGALVIALCLVGAFSLRAETFAVGPALLLARALTFGRASLVRDLRALLPGGVVAFAVLAGMNYISYANVMPAHVQQQVGGGLTSWELRRDAIQWLLLPPSRLPFVAGLGVALGAAFLRGPRMRLLAAQAGVAVMLAASFGPALWRTFALGRPWAASFEMPSLAHTWPIAAVLCLLPALRPLRDRERLLALATGATLLFTLAALPQTGGAQWSARFFLAVMPAGAALAIELARRRGTRILAATAIVASMALQVYGLTQLRYYKRINAQITHFTATATQSGDIIVSDIFWYPQVTVSLYPTRRLLYALTPTDVDAIAARAAHAGFGAMWVAAVTPLTGYVPPPTLPGGFVHTSQRDAGIGSVTLHHYTRALAR
jgi:hypothetical protein